MSFGGYHPYPRRFGGNRYNGKPLTEVVHASLNAQRGPAFNTEDTTTIVWLENLAYARALANDGWETNARVANQWDPQRTTDMLPRWEDIFKLRPAPTATGQSRRAELLLRWQRFGEVSNHARIVTAMTAALGSCFVAVEYIDISIANVHVPDASYPWGTVVDGVPWSSTVAHVLVRTQKPTGMSEGEFYDTVGRVVLTLDPVVSAWIYVDWYRPGPTSEAVTGGPSAAGFYLDDDHNLDNEVLDEFTPQQLSLTGYWSPIVPYDATAGRWIGTPTRGTSGTHHVSEATNKPSTVATLNGNPTVRFGTPNFLSGEIISPSATAWLMSELFGVDGSGNTTAGWCWCLFKPTSPAPVTSTDYSMSGSPSAANYANDALWADLGNRRALSVRAGGGGQVGTTEDVGTWWGVEASAATGSWTLVQMWISATSPGGPSDLYIQSNSGAVVSTLARGGMTVASNYFQMGKALGADATPRGYFTGDIAEMAFRATAPSAEERAQVLAWINSKYGLSL